MYLLVLIVAGHFSCYRSSIWDTDKHTQYDEEELDHRYCRSIQNSEQILPTVLHDMIISGVCDPSFRLSHFREICKYDILFRRATIPMSVYNTFISILFCCCIHNQNTHIRTHAPPLNMLLCEWQIHIGLIKIRLQLFPNQNGDPKI